MTDASVTRPAIRYFGGKWKLAPWVIAHMPPHTKYVETHGGAGSVLLQKPRAIAEVYNDLDESVVTLFRVLRDPVAAAELKRRVELTPFARAEFDNVAKRRDDDPGTDSITRSWRLVVRAMLGYGSSRTGGNGFRWSRNDKGTTAADDWVTWPDAVPAMVARLRGVIIECRHALRVIREHDDDDTLFYVDPPYVRTTRSSPRDGYLHEMSDRDHRHLAAELHAAQGMVMLSGYHSPLYDELYDWAHYETTANAGNRGGTARPRRRVEVLWMNARAHRAWLDAQSQLSLLSGGSTDETAPLLDAARHLRGAGQHDGRTGDDTATNDGGRPSSRRGVRRDGDFTTVGRKRRRRSGGV